LPAVLIALASVTDSLVTLLLAAAIAYLVVRVARTRRNDPTAVA
jgi:hypothetical protein